jgi:hypothetical protein
VPSCSILQIPAKYREIVAIFSQFVKKNCGKVVENYQNTVVLLKYAKFA